MRIKPYPAPNSQRHAILPLFHSAISPRRGQALTELMTGMIAVIILTAGLIQISLMSRARSDAMLEAREDAGSRSMTDIAAGMSILSNPDYIQDWTEGADGKRLSADDMFNEGNPDQCQQMIVERSGAGAGDWTIINSVPNNGISRLRADPQVVSSLGLVDATANRSVPVIPAVRHLSYAADSIDIECKVWMTLTKGVY